MIMSKKTILMILEQKIDKIMSTISKNYKIIIFSFFNFFLRLPFFFTDVFNWDESTYIIIGQWIVDGGLPYLGRTEIKPPLLGYLYSFFVFFSLVNFI